MIQFELPREYPELNGVTCTAPNSSWQTETQIKLSSLHGCMPFVLVWIVTMRTSPLSESTPPAGLYWGQNWLPACCNTSSSSRRPPRPSEVPGASCNTSTFMRLQTRDYYKDFFILYSFDIQLLMTLYFMKCIISI